MVSESGEAFPNEAEQLGRQKTYLEQQLDDKNRQLLTIHGNHNKEVGCDPCDFVGSISRFLSLNKSTLFTLFAHQVIDLRGQVDLKINENEKLEEMKKALTASNTELNKTLEDLNQKLKEVGGSGIV